MISSILDNDLYKFTQAFAVISNRDLCDLKVRYQFFNRNGVKFPDGFDIELKKRVQEMSTLQMTKDEKAFFERKCGDYLPHWFFDYLEGYRYDPNEVFIFMENGNLKVKIEGYWFHTILWEVPLMAIISELYFEMTNKAYDFNNSGNRQTRLDNNIKKANLMKMNNLKVSDFGTRRRYSYENHKEVVGDLVSYAKGNLVGTSNVHFAHLYNINAHGTNAHEWYMIFAALYGYKLANKMATDAWSAVYGGKLGTVLTDTFTTDEFLKTFDTKQAKLYDGVRQDSGSPFEYADKVVAHYKSLGIDPSTKTIIFSDGLDVKIADSINVYCNKLGIRCSFGIGTNLTNDIFQDGSVKPLNIVIKATHVFYKNEWHNTVKLSDNLGKHTGNLEEIQLCKKILNIKDITFDNQPAGNKDDRPSVNVVD